MAFPIYRRNVILSFSHYTFDPQYIHVSRELVSLTISLPFLILFLSFGSPILRLLTQTEDMWSFMWISDFNSKYRIKITSTVVRVALQPFLQQGNVSFSPHNAFWVSYDNQETQHFFSYTTTCSRNSEASIIIRLRDGWSRNRGLILNRGERGFPSMVISDRLCCPL